MELHLTRKTAVVTGASRGIGLAIVRALRAEGMRVVGASRTITSELEDTGAVPVAVDLGTSDGATELIEHARAELGGIDVLVNNVGGGDAAPGGFLAIDDETWRRGLDVNFLAAVRVTRAALPSLIERRGVIVTISSNAARLPVGPADYNAAKAALSNLGKSLADEFGPQGVRVVTVSPGPTRTAMWEAPDGFGAKSAEAAGVELTEFLAQLPEAMGLTTGRLGEPDEVANLVAFLASDRAAGITGAEYLIDGGMVKTV